MIYLDYSATTPVNKEVLDAFNKVSLDYIGNANSMHTLGQESNNLMEESVMQVAHILGVESDEVIFTSGATESNNLAIKGICSIKKRGHIITTKIEHSSVSETVKYLARNGYDVDYVPLDDNGLVDIKELESLIKDETVLVSICMVNSEVGLLKPVDEIGELLKEYKNIVYHVDGTQAVGKVNTNLENIDLFSLSAHKFYGLKGIGILIKKKNINLEVLMHGGKSQTDYRAGTPALALMASTAKALRLAVEDLDAKYASVKKMNTKIISELIELDGISVNSNDYCIPHILNISLIYIKPETFINAMSKEGIHLSTQSACSRKNDTSKTLLAMKKTREEILGSIRISLSFKTTEKEVEEFLKVFNKTYQELNKLFKGE